MEDISNSSCQDDLVFGDCAEEFMKPEGHCFINHGSLGSVPREIFDYRIKLLEQQETTVEKWFRQDFKHMMLSNLKSVSTFVNSDHSDIVFSSNTTTAINTVLKSINFTSQDSILIYSWTYLSIMNAVEEVCHQTGAKLLMIDVKLPLTSEQLIESYRDMFERNSNIKFTVLDGISCATATRVPFEDIIPICKQHGSLVMLDGAHLPGQVHLDLKHLQSIGLDFFAGNLHKWLFVPRGCAILWVKDSNKHLIKPLVTSIFYKQGFLMDFVYSGTNDDSQYFTVERSIEFFNRIGGLSALNDYNIDLLEKAANMLTKRWGTCRFPISSDLEAPFMRIIELPDAKLFHQDEIPHDKEYKDMTIAMNELAVKYTLYTYLVVINGRKWIRICAQVYNSMKDYARLAEVVDLLVKE